MDTMAHLELMVEERSMYEVLGNILPQVFPHGEATWCVRIFNGKSDLLRKLPDRLRGRSRSLGSNSKIVVLLDRDRDDCHELKEELEDIARAEHLTTKTECPGGAFHVLNRIAIEELEAWFFGDPEAIVKAFPNVSLTAMRKRRYRDPDRIDGGTWEALERELQRAGYYSTGMLKVEAARKISKHMDIEKNRSRSFNVFIGGIRAAASIEY